MENQLIQLCLFVCQIYDTRSQTCFQRLSNNSKPDFTDQELVCIWFFGHLNGKFQKKQIHDFILTYWAAWFPRLPAYQTFCYRLNLLEQTLQSIGAELFAHCRAEQTPELDHLIDSFWLIHFPWCWRQTDTLIQHELPARLPMSVIARQRKSVFTVSACTSLPKNAFKDCPIRRKSGCVKHPFTTWLPPKNNIWNCRTLLWLPTSLIPNRLFSKLSTGKTLIFIRGGKSRKVPTWPSLKNITTASSVNSANRLKAFLIG